MSIGGHRHFSDVDEYSCHLCDDGHPMDVASQVSMCSRFQDVQERHIAACPPPVPPGGGCLEGDSRQSGATLFHEDSGSE